MATHYDVLGVTASASPARVRQAYYAKARALHPDASAGRPAGELDATRRAMQDVNEAWRVLRDARTRAAYDQSLQASTPRWAQSAPPDDHDHDEDEWMDRPFEQRAAEPGDLTIAIVRAVPWIAVLVVLTAIFVFTAFARDRGGGSDLVGKCVTFDAASAEAVPCDQPNDGRVVGLVDREGLCMNGTTARQVGGGVWYCLKLVDDE
jgi:curved DNA-binding protein CbpA